jgi:hypothetical protein
MVVSTTALLAALGGTATAAPCVTNGCRVTPGIYSGKGAMYVGPMAPAAKNQITLNQSSNTPYLVRGTCHQSNVASPFSFSVRPDDSLPEWKFAGRPPIIGQTTTYHRKLKHGDATYNNAYDITVKVKMLTAKSGTVSISETYVIHSNQQGSQGVYTSTCTAKGRFAVKKR